MDRVLVTARAHRCPILKQSSRDDFGVVAVICTFELEPSERRVIHFDLNQRTVTPLSDNQLAFISRKSWCCRDGIGEDSGDQFASVIIAIEFFQVPVCGKDNKLATNC